MTKRADIRRAIKEGAATRVTCKPPNTKSLTIVMLALNLFNLNVDVWPFRTQKFAGMLYTDDGTFTIVVNRNHPSHKQIFTMAHEIGHYILHRDQLTEFLCNELFASNRRYLEIEANRFAAELLMPVNEYVIALEACDGHFREVAEHFYVSEEAARWRCVDLVVDNLGISKNEVIEKIVVPYQQRLNTISKFVQAVNGGFY